MIPLPRRLQARSSRTGMAALAVVTLFLPMSAAIAAPPALRGSAPARIGATIDLAAGDTPPGWSGPIVPRDDATASAGSVGPSPTLPGNVAGTYLNIATHVTGGGSVAAAISQISADDSVLAANPFDATAPMFVLATNIGPFTVRGGRHTLTGVVDPADAVPETDEGDNTDARQWVWRPLVTTERVPNGRPLPPAKGLGAYPNSDGFAFTHAPGAAWVVGEAARNNGDDDDLLVYDDYTGSTSGFSHQIAFSNLGGNNTDFVVGHRSATPLTVYPAVTRYSVVGGGGGFAMDQADSHGRTGDMDATPAFSWQATLTGDRLADVYEAYMDVGLTYYFTLRVSVGGTPCGFEVFPSTSGGIHGRGGGNTSVFLGFDHELAYVPTATGWHPVVVYRQSGSGASAPVSYDFEWSTSGYVGVPGGDDRVTEPSFAGVSPNPVARQGRFEFALPSSAHVSLGLYDVAGRRVRALVDERLEAGRHGVDWDGHAADGARVTAGVYWARLDVDGRTFVRRVAVLP